MSEKRVKQGPIYLNIPSEWNMREIGDMYEAINGKSFSSSKWGDTGTKIIKIKNLTGSSENQMKRTQQEVEDKYKVSSGDLLYCWAGYRGSSFGSYIWTGDEAYLNQHIFRLEQKDDSISKHFTHHVLNDSTRIIESIAVGAARQVHITKTDFKRFRIPVPSLAEQRRIASVLYSVDEQIRTLTDRHDSLAQLKHGLMQDLLTGETRVTPEMNVNEEVEKEPAVITDEDWSEETLTQVADIVMGNSPDSKHYNEEKNGKPFLQGNNEFSYRNPSPDRWCSVDKKIAEKGDIMISIRAPVGDTNIADTNYVIGRGLASVSSEVMNHEFLYHLIGYNQPYLERISVGSTFDSISYREFNYVEVPVPPLWEQERIASILYTVDEMIARTNDLIDEYERLKRGLMQDLLSGDVRTPEDLSVLDEIKLDADSTGADGSSVTQSTLDV